MLRPLKFKTLMGVLVVAVVAGGCRTTSSDVRTERRVTHRGRLDPVLRVFCLYDHKPWMSLDAAGDRDPEGIHYRVFLDAGGGRGVVRDGSFRVEMYRIGRSSPEGIERTLVSDWEYPTSAFPRVKSKIFGSGYHLRLRWAQKELAGHEVEVITQFKTPAGSIVRSGTKRLRVPRHTS